jgi:hypothetical protein
MSNIYILYDFFYMMYIFARQPFPPFPIQEARACVGVCALGTGGNALWVSFACVVRACVRVCVTKTHTQTQAYIIQAHARGIFVAFSLKLCILRIRIQHTCNIVHLSQTWEGRERW